MSSTLVACWDHIENVERDHTDQHLIPRSHSVSSSDPGQKDCPYHWEDLNRTEKLAISGPVSQRTNDYKMVCGTHQESPGGSKRREVMRFIEPDHEHREADQDGEDHVNPDGSRDRLLRLAHK